MLSDAQRGDGDDHAGDPMKASGNPDVIFREVAPADNQQRASLLRQECRGAIRAPCGVFRVARPEAPEQLVYTQLGGALVHPAIMVVEVSNTFRDGSPHVGLASNHAFEIPQMRCRSDPLLGGMKCSVNLFSLGGKAESEESRLISPADCNGSRVTPPTKLVIVPLRHLLVKVLHREPDLGLKKKWPCETDFTSNKWYAMPRKERRSHDHTSPC